MGEKASSHPPVTIAARTHSRVRDHLETRKEEGRRVGHHRAGGWAGSALFPQRHDITPLGITSPIR
jgi:hypothetical protein